MGLSEALQTKLVLSLILIVCLFLLRSIALKIVWRHSEDVRTRYVWRKATIYALVILFLLFMGQVWISGYQSITTFFGLLSAGLVITLKDPITNMAGWVFIIVRRTFALGDRIELSGQAGDVIDIRLFQFTLMEIGNWVDADQSTGRIIHIPNGKVFTETLANYSKGFQYIWNEVPVLVTFESDWKTAKDLLVNIANKHAEHLSPLAEEKIKEASKKFMIYYSILTPTVYTSVKDSGVLLTIRYLCEPRQRRTTEQSIWEDILREFARRSDIDWAYPTQRFYDNLREGKAGTKPPSS